MSKKNLDNLFQERFKDFGETPDDNVWYAIEASLDKRKKKRVVPLWWTLGGVAALLAIALMIFNPLTKGNENIPNVTITEPSGKIKNNGAIRTSDNIENTTLTESDRPLEDSNSNSQLNNGANSLVEQNVDQLNIKQSTSNSKQGLNSSATKSQLAQSNSSNPKREKGEKLASSIDEQNSLSQTDSDIINSNLTKSDEDSFNENTDRKEVAFSKPQTEDDIVEDLESRQKSFDTEEQVIAKNEEAEILLEEANQKKSLLDAIEEQNEEKEALAEVTHSKWSAGPSVAPVYFNGVGNGSPIHSAFNQNSKSGNTNLSYGLGVAYQINEKLKVRSGIHKVNYGYDTDNVAFTSIPDASSSEQIKNINYTPTAKNIVVDSKIATFSSLSRPLNDLALDVSNASVPSRTGSMAQQLGYLEVPLELDYALLDRKFGVNIVGGISSLFLLDNMVTLTSGELTTEVGEANNVNDINFSTNIGFGVNYKFTPAIQFNVEPVFKYQLNTFSEVSGDFRPFTVGVYSGLNFRF
ncbi:outer membrane beta-barrel protein [Pseudozobellia sp. WGM2]|uniref:outer membrane beta-barrel protein n=1 Tax=Pseudozobellia sp. WGM2 TaxID=2787625 RepID=UPI001ADF3713|nr:outer membrane beta-barrel protein [Pseudozobellia sp. WGM2]